MLNNSKRVHLMQPVANNSSQFSFIALGNNIFTMRIFHASIVRRCYKLEPFTACAQPSVRYVECARKKLDATITTSSIGPLRQKSWSSNSTKIRHLKRNSVCHSNRHRACHRIVLLLLLLCGWCLHQYYYSFRARRRWIFTFAFAGLRREGKIKTATDSTQRTDGSNFTYVCVFFMVAINLRRWGVVRWHWQTSSKWVSLTSGTTRER